MFRDSGLTPLDRKNVRPHEGAEEDGLTWMQRQDDNWLMKSIPTLVIFTLAFSLGGRSAGSPVEVIPESLRGAIQPQAAVSADGAVHVAFGKSSTIYCATSLDGGK